MKKTVNEVSRRRALGTLGAVASAVVAGCSSSPTAAELPTATPTPTPSPAAASGACAVSPNETVGPYPSLRDFLRSDGATHIHVEVTLNGRSIKVTQIAFPESVTAAVYASGVYASKGQNPTSNASDNVFADGVQNEMATLVGSPASGYDATFTVGVSI